MKSRESANPPNRFHTQIVTYDDGEGPPPANVTVIEDRSRSILSENDSPDIGFRWSVNPYRGCQHACAYCVAPETPILLGDGHTRCMADVKVGDDIYGTELAGNDRRMVRTKVLDHWRTRRLAYRIRLADGSELVASGDHRFLSDRGWKYVMPEAARPFLTPGDVLLGVAGQRIMSIEDVGLRDLVDITTGTGDFIANGVISHNCYARPSHEYLDMGAGTDFDTKIVVKREAPELLRAAFDKPSWKGELVMFSGVTDCYQPLEKELELTRRCLEVCLEYRNPVSVISKSALVMRDVELFAGLARDARFHHSVSLAFTDAEMARALEPWAPSPERRLKVIEAMAAAGVPVGVMIAPVIPGLNDSQLVELLERAVAAGATWAGWALLRLPGAVKEVFEERVRVALPLAGDRIMHRIRETRGGKLYDARFHVRGRGEGVYAQTIGKLFETTCTRLGLGVRDRNKDEEDDRTTTFCRPPKKTNQLSLF